jgi:hypothetical protein
MVSGLIWIKGAPLSQAALYSRIKTVAGGAISGQLRAKKFIKPSDDIVFFADRQTGRNKFAGVFFETKVLNKTTARALAQNASINYSNRDSKIQIDLYNGDIFATEPLLSKYVITFKHLTFTTSAEKQLKQKTSFLPLIMRIPTAELFKQSLPQIPKNIWQFELGRRLDGPVNFLMMAVISTFLAFAVTWRQRIFAILTGGGFFLATLLLQRFFELLVKKDILGGLFGAFATTLVITAVFSIVFSIKTKIFKVVRQTKDITN